MKDKTQTKLKWVMVSIIITHLLCFFPNDMIALPVIVAESGALTSFLQWNSISDIILNGIVFGQIIAVCFLILKTSIRTWVMGLFAVLLLLSVNMLWLIDKNVSIVSFECMTSIPFLLSAIGYFVIGIKNRLWFSNKLLSNDSII